MAYRKLDPNLPKIGARLELTRRALDLTRFQMARLLGTNMATWGTYEAGLERIPPEQAVKLCAYGIPLDWIYRGRATNLPPHIRSKIREERDARLRASRPDRTPRHGGASYGRGRLAGLRVPPQRL